MPFSNPRPCFTRGCNQLTRKKFCDSCESAGKARDNRPTSRERGYNAAWFKYRAVYLALHPFCVDPFKLHIERVRATRLDHIEPHRGNRELFWNPANHQGLCEGCHNRKTVEFDGGFGRQRKQFTQ
jgi:5-methylcytosine-specific restriction enzyme A